MKKLLFISVIFLASCSKEKGNCYDCYFGTVNGVNPPHVEYCGEMPHQFTDAQGNPLQSFCRLK